MSLNRVGRTVISMRRKIIMMLKLTKKINSTMIIRKLKFHYPRKKKVANKKMNSSADSKDVGKNTNLTPDSKFMKEHM